MGTDKTGRIVWHDLFTTDRQRAMSFYRSLAGREYVTEYATNFAWGGGARDYILALKESEAGAGIVIPPSDMPAGWVAYVEVDDVDTAGVMAEKLGGDVLRPPFDVPGVGRNALLRDPNGATIGLAMSRHSFPVPQQQFGAEVYLSGKGTFPSNFYARLFGWEIGKAQVEEGHSRIAIAAKGQIVATAWKDPPVENLASCWVPTIKVTDPPDARRRVSALGGNYWCRINDDHIPPNPLFLEDTAWPSMLRSMPRTGKAISGTTMPMC